MPAFQSVLNSSLSRKYYLKAVGCEKCAEHASDLTTEQQWRELAEQWLSLACRAEKNQATLRWMNQSKADPVKLSKIATT
jgi:hypothetical protein